MGTHLYDSFHSLERMLEGHQELSKDVLKKFGGHVQCNGCNNVWGDMLSLMGVKEDEPYGASGCVADCDNKVGIQLRVGEGV